MGEHHRGPDVGISAGPYAATFPSRHSAAKGTRATWRAHGAPRRPEKLSFVRALIIAVGWTGGMIPRPARPSRSP